MFHKVEGRNDVLKNPKQGLVVPSNSKAKDEYFQKKAMMNERRAFEIEKQQMKEDIHRLNNDMTDIKQMLRKLLEHADIQ